MINNKLPTNTIVFRNKQKICDYNGQIINEFQLQKRYGDKTAPQAIELNNQKYEDGATHRGIGTLLNSANRS